MNTFILDKTTCINPKQIFHPLVFRGNGDLIEFNKKLDQVKSILIEKHKFVDKELKIWEDANFDKKNYQHITVLLVSVLNGKHLNLFDFYLNY